MKYVYFPLLLLLFSSMAFGQEESYGIGKPVKDFTLTDANNKAVSLSDHAASKAVVIAFVNPYCPNSRIYSKRLRDLAAAYASKGVSFIYINPGISMESGGTQVKALAEEISATEDPVSILADPQHQVTSRFGATKVPEVYVLQGDNGSFTLKYKGAIDDNPQLQSGVREYYLRNALDAVLAGRPVLTPEKRTFGCLIKRF